MKKKKLGLIVGVPIIVLLAIMIVHYGRKIGLYQEYRYPDEEFYGKELYSEIVYNCSGSEKEIGNALLDKAIKISEYKGTEQEAENEFGDVGALREYYLFYNKGAIAQEIAFQFITSKITGDEGHVWIVYTSRIHYSDDRMGSSTDILTLWDIENQGGEWVVTRIIEAP